MTAPGHPGNAPPHASDAKDGGRPLVDPLPLRAAASPAGIPRPSARARDRSFEIAERCRSRTSQPMGYNCLPSLKTGWSCGSGCAPPRCLIVVVWEFAVSAPDGRVRGYSRRERFDVAAASASVRALEHLLVVGSVCGAGVCVGGRVALGEFGD